MKIDQNRCTVSYSIPLLKILKTQSLRYSVKCVKTQSPQYMGKLVKKISSTKGGIIKT